MTEITHTTCVLAVRDLDSAKAFYIERLGFQEDFSVEGWAFLSRDRCQLRLGHCPDSPPASACGDHAWFAYLHVTDAQAIYAEFQAGGAPILHEIQDQAWGYREFSILTPDGHRMVFGQDLEV